MSDPNKIEVSIGAKLDELIAGFEAASSVVSEAALKIEESVKTAMESADVSLAKTGEAAEKAAVHVKESATLMGQAMEGVKEKFAGIGEAMIAAFATKEGLEFLDKWAEKAEGIRNTSEMLGLTTMQVQRLNAAAKLTGVSTEALNKSAGILAKTMAAAADGNKEAQATLRSLGVATSDYKNLNFEEVLGKIADKAAASKDGLEKLAVAKKGLGRSAQELIPLLDLGSEGIKDLGDQAERSGALMSDKMVNDGVALKESLNDLNMMVEAVKNELADAFAPMLEFIIEVMKNTGDGAVDLETVFKGLAAVVIVVATVVMEVFKLVKLAVQELVTVVATQIDALNHLRHWELKAARESMKQGLKQMTDNFKLSTDDMVDTASKAMEAIAKIFNNGAAKAGGADERPKKPKLGMDDSNGSGTKEKGADTRLQQWQQQLDDMKLAEDAFHEMSTADEISFWQQKLALTKTGSTEQLAVTRTLLALKKQAAKEEFTNAMSDLAEKYDAEVQGSQERVALAQQELDLVVSTYGKDTAQYMAAQKKKEQATREYQNAVNNAQLDTIKHAEEAALAEIKIRQDHYKLLAQMGQISKSDLIQIEEQLEANILGIKMAANENAQALDNLTREQKKKLADDLVKIQADADVRMAQLQGESMLNTQQMWNSYFQTITQGFATTLQGMIAGTTTFKQGMLQIGSQLLSQFLSQEAAKLASYLSGQVAMTTATVAGNTARAASTVAANTTTTASNASTAIGSILASAASVFGKIYDAIAGIPFIGPFLAPVMAVAGMAVVAGMVGKVASAEGGWDNVPHDGAMTMLHKQEMVLPAPLAEAVRNMAAQGGGGSRPQVHIHAMDAQSFMHFAVNNPEAFAAAFNTFLGNNPGYSR